MRPATDTNLLGSGPYLEVVLLGRGVVELAGHNVYHAVGQAQLAGELLCRLPHLLVLTGEGSGAAM